ncbi:MAG: ABC transporter ATP-binding protein, partial [Clostridia bacterium]|nr:ABC transporter ATP-binding protein [Clostridia bacterium]
MEQKMNKIIKIDNLCKTFGDVKAVQDLSFSVNEGELFAFLGVNGAGKSTTINIMCGQLSKDGGTVEINGADLDKNLDTVKTSLGVVFQQSVLDMFLSVYDNLESRAALYGIYGKEFKERLGELAKLLDFEDLLKRPVGKLSGG